MNYQKIIQKIPKEALEKENLTEAEVLYYAENVKYTDDKLFRYVFASNTKVSNNLLKYFIGLLLEVEVVSVVINNSVFVTQRKNQKGACFDVLATIKTKNGNESIVNVEMQNYGSLEVISRRAQSYISELVVTQLVKGDRNYKFDTIYQVMLLGKKKLKGKSHNRKYVYYDYLENEELIGNRGIIRFIELSKLRNIDMHHASELDKFCYFLQYSHLENKHDIMVMLMKENGMLRMLEKRKETYMQTLAERLNDIREYYDELLGDTVIEYEKKEARKEGLAEGRAEGRAEGIAEGIAQAKSEFVYTLSSKGMSIENIAEIVDLSVEKICEILEGKEHS